MSQESENYGIENERGGGEDSMVAESLGERGALFRRRTKCELTASKCRGARKGTGRVVLGGKSARSHEVRGRSRELKGDLEKGQRTQKILSVRAAFSSLPSFRGGLKEVRRRAGSKLLR